MSLPIHELRMFAEWLTAQRERWEPLLAAAERSDARVYEQIWDDEHVNAWVIRWSEDADTGFHDHDVSGAAIAVVSGRVREDRLTIGGTPYGREIDAGEMFIVEPVAIHRVLHAGSGPAVTIHAYSPPLRRTGAYRLGPDGTLQRESQAFDTELRADEPAYA